MDTNLQLTLTAQEDSLLSIERTGDEFRLKAGDVVEIATNFNATRRLNVSVYVDLGRVVVERDPLFICINGIRVANYSLEKG